MIVRTRWLAVAATLLTTLGVASSVAAQPPTSGPVVTLDRTEVGVGERLLLTIDGFEARSVTITVCGNEARRGSVDCNMAASEGLHLDVDGSSSVQPMPIAAPPAPCPCVIRVSSRMNDEIAVAPFVLLGHPVAPVVDTANLDGALSVSITARADPRGFVEWGRSNLGGPTIYEVTVTVKNRTAVPFRHIKVAASVGRDDDDILATLNLDDPGDLGPGQTWQRVVYEEVPAPTFGEVQWRVEVSGAGAAVTAVESTQHRPLLLMVVVMLLVLDISVLLVRYLMRRHAGIAEAKAAALNAAV